MFGLGLEIGIWLELNFELGVVTSIEVYMRFRLKVEVRIALTQTLTLTLNLNPNPNPNTIGNAVICIAVIGVAPDCTLEGKYLRCVVRVSICCTLWYSWYE